MNPSIDPADFNGQSNVMVTFGPSDSEQFVSVSVVNDDIVESNEMFTATLTTTGSLVTIGPSNTATAIIIDNDGKSLISMICVPPPPLPPNCSAIFVQCTYIHTVPGCPFVYHITLGHVLHSQASFLASAACSIKFALKTTSIVCTVASYYETTGLTYVLATNLHILFCVMNSKCIFFSTLTCNVFHIVKDIFAVCELNEVHFSPGQVLGPSIVSISPELVVHLMCRSCLGV